MYGQITLMPAEVLGPIESECDLAFFAEQRDKRPSKSLNAVGHESFAVCQDPVGS
jgi:hypothetical protein